MTYQRNKLQFNFEKPSHHETVAEILGYPILAIPERKLSKETCHTFGIRTALDPKDGVTPIAHYFPAYDKSDNIVGFKKRDLTKAKHEDFHFTTIGKVGTDCKLFGQSQAEKITRKHKRLFFVEGEYDVAAAHEALTKVVKDTKYADLVPFVVGLNCGCGNASQSALHNESFLNSFEEIVLGFDNDKATDDELKKGIMRGKEATDAVASALMADNLFIAAYRENLKDPCDYIIRGLFKELSADLGFADTKYTAEKIISASSVSLESFMKSLPEGVLIPTFPRLNKILHGIRESELTVVTAPSNAGKTTVVSEFLYQLMAAGKRCGAIFLEEKKEETIKRLGARYLGVDFKSFKEKPTKVGKSPDELAQAHNWVTGQDKLFIVDHFGSMPIDTLMNKIKYLHYVCKCDVIILDHLSMVISGSAIKDERKELDMVMTQLASFCASSTCHVIIVNHLNRDIASEFKPPKGKEDEPFWVRVTKEQLRGSASIEQLAWNIVAIEPQIMPDRSRGNVRLVVLKNREWSYLGVADEFHVDDSTGEFILEENF